MAFNPNLPVDDSPLDAAEMRNQLTALKTLIDAQQVTINAQAAQIATLTQQLSSRPTMDEVNAAIVIGIAAKMGDITYTQMTPSDPPTQSDLQTVIDLLNSVITALKQQG